MRRQRIVLLLLLSLCAAIWLTRSLWLPPLTTQLNLDARPLLVQLLQAAANIGGLAILASLLCLLWLSWHREGATADGGRRRCDRSTPVHSGRAWAAAAR
jgi:hypothetical protein